MAAAPTATTTSLIVQHTNFFVDSSLPIEDLDNTTVNTEAPPSTDAPVEPIEVYPAVGTMNGVIASQVPIDDDSDRTERLQYTCADGARTASFSGGQEVEFDGVNITVDYGDYASQTISLSGNTDGFLPVSLIVQHTNFFVDSSLPIEDLDNTRTLIGADQVVNITPEMIANGSLLIGGTNFGLTETSEDAATGDTTSSFSVVYYTFCFQQG